MVDFDVLLTIILGLITLFVLVNSFYRIRSAWKEYEKIETKKEYTGCEAAREILDHNNLSSVYVVEARGILKNHYDSNRKVIRLSKEVFHGSSIASIAVASFLCGYAIQDQKGKTMLHIRDTLLPFLYFLTIVSYVGMIFSILSGTLYYLELSIGLMAIILGFHACLISLERNSFQIAFEQIQKLSIVTIKEIDMVKDMLNHYSRVSLASPLSFVVDWVEERLKR